jgi:RND family efflux transporter MFP subunit
MRAIFRIMTGMVAAAILSGCASRDQVQNDIVRKVKVATPVIEPDIPTRKFPGLIREAAEVNLAFRVAGPIRNIYVKEGDYVRQGTLVARIDPRDYEIQVNVYEAQYTQVRAEYDRFKELNSRKSLADNDYEKSVAGEKMLRMKLQNARDQLSDTRLVAPFSGYIQSVKYEEGEMVNTGMCVATLVDVKSYMVETDLPASFFIRKEEFTDFSCSLSMMPDETYPLQLAGYRIKANNSQLYRATFRLDPKSNTALAPGMTVNVVIGYRNGPESSLMIPLTALFHKEGKPFVWKYDSTSSTVEKQEVTTGALAGNGMVTILSGVSENDKIVVAGVHSLREGDRVSLLQEASETNLGGML